MALDISEFETYPADKFPNSIFRYMSTSNQIQVQDFLNGLTFGYCNIHFVLFHLLGPLIMSVRQTFSFFVSLILFLFCTNGVLENTVVNNKILETQF